MNEVRPRAHSGSSAYRSPMSRARPGTRPSARNPWATPFSGWAFHRAWWDAYGANAHEETLVLRRADAPADAEPVAIVPLMHRHEVEPSDAVTHTRMRHGADFDLTPVRPTATAILFGASYHADYATMLAARRTSPRSPPRSRLPGRSLRSPAVGRRGPPPSPLRRPGGGRPGRGVRRARERRGLDPRRRARGRLPGRDAADRADIEATSRPSARRSVTRSGARSAGPRASARCDWTTPRIRWPTSRCSSSSTRRNGATTACSPTRLAAPRAACSSGACSSSMGRAGRCACRSCRWPTGASRPGSTSTSATDTCTTTPGWTPPRATCRPA